jgi:hypothetical protein
MTKEGRSCATISSIYLVHGIAYQRRGKPCTERFGPRLSTSRILPFLQNVTMILFLYLTT